jgi:hypothetical protein
LADGDIEVNALADQIHMEAVGPRAAPQCAHWEVDGASLFIQGIKITSNMKHKMKSRLHNREAKEYLIEREEWTSMVFDSVAWDSYGVECRWMSRNRRIAVSKACYNIWHTGVKHHLYCHEVRPGCMCHNEKGDWWHVLSCPSLDAALHRAESWKKLKKSMERWKLPQDLWTAVEMGIWSYIKMPAKAKYRTQPITPFPATLNRQWNSLKKSFCSQSKIGWESFTKGCITREWTQFVSRHYENQGHKLKANYWPPKFIGELW